MVEVKFEIKDGHALEVIQADRGIEVERFRYEPGAAIEIDFSDNETFLFHEVPVSPLESKPGNLVHGDIEKPKVEAPAAMDPPAEKPFDERMAALEEFYDSASVALHQMSEVLADTIHDDSTKLLLIEQILETDIDTPAQPLQAGDYEGCPHLQNPDGAA